MNYKICPTCFIIDISYDLICSSLGFLYNMCIYIYIYNLSFLPSYFSSHPPQLPRCHRRQDTGQGTYFPQLRTAFFMFPKVLPRELENSGKEWPSWRKPNKLLIDPIKIHMCIYNYIYICLYIIIYICICTPPKTYLLGSRCVLDIPFLTAYIVTCCSTTAEKYLFRWERRKKNLHIYIYTYTYLYMYIYIYVCTYIQTHIYIYIYICTYIHIYIYTYIHTYITLHYITLHYITLHYITIQYNTIQYNTYITYIHTYITLYTLHYITLHYITLHYITLHYITLQYIHTYIYTYPYMHIHIYTYTIYIYTYTNTHTNTHAMYMYMYMYMHMCTVHVFGYCIVSLGGRWSSNM